MSEANRSFVRYAIETTPGVTPTSPTFKELLYVSSSFVFKPTELQDDSITSDRQIAASTQVGYETNGDNVHRLRYGVLDELFQAAFMGTWTAYVSLAATGVTQSTGTYAVAAGGTAFKAGMLVLVAGFANAANNGVKKVASSSGTTIVVGAITGGADETIASTVKAVGFEGGSGDLVLNATSGNHMTSTTIDFTTLPLVVGEWIWIGGSVVGNQFATAADRGWYRISAIAAHILTFDSVPNGFVADAGTSKTVRIFWGDILRSGTTYASVTIEREYVGDDNVSRFRYFRGIRLGVNIEATSKQMITVTFSGMGMSASRITSTRQSGATTQVLTSNQDTDVFDGANNVTEVRLNNLPMIDPNIPISLNMQIDNGFRGRSGLTTKAFTAIKAGSINLTGTLEAYLGDASQVNLLQDDTYFPIAMPMLSKDRAEGYLIDIPRAKFTDGGETVTGKDTDIMPKLTYLGHRSSGTPNYTGQLQRFDYLEAA